ncbi:MAG TPA: MerR family transcriptional regulator [Actinomycetota bacterium]|nr:MerR family transcriptional regulator [Actinomycetota bacterium]
MATRSYMSIGEVLVTLKTEFPDITISKIRFLEGEGLIDPERTPSGYRKFYEEDVDRLRTILKMQRDEYLPLKVIKERLTRSDEEPLVEEAPNGESPNEKAIVEEIATPPTGLHMSVDELAAATGVERERIKELESFGILCAHGMNGDSYYDGDDFVTLSIVKDFFKFGIEPRHLTMYRHFAEREASFFEGIVMPVLRQRNPDAKRSAAASLGELSSISRKFKQALLRTNLRPYLQSQ